MPDKKQLGVYWGDNSLFFVETVTVNPKRFFSVPLIQEESVIAEPTGAAKGISLASLISNSFRKQNINPSTVNLSLPTKEIIFRTFIIPWMQSHELKGVVAFEASKYIPFSLEDLSYAFHPVTINEGGTRRIRIILVAIKRTILDNFTSALEQANLSVETIEPSFLSLIRTLNLNSALQLNQTVAIFQKRNVVGEIIITNRGIPQFVREFPLGTAGAAPDPNSADYMTRLLNEIRISLDYFNRQDNQLQVEQIVLLTSSTTEEFSRNLETDLGIPIKPISIQSILGNNRINETDYINAFGAGLVDGVESPISFDFSRKKSSGSKLKVSNIKKVANIQSVVITFVICAFLIALTFVITKGFVTGPQNEVSTLTQQLGVFEGAPVEKLRETTNTYKVKLDALKELRIENNVSLFLNSIARLLPEGVWIRDLDIYETPMPRGAPSIPGAKKISNLVIELNGYAYSENPNKEFQLVTKFQENMQADTSFTKVFSTNISLEDVKAQKLTEYDVVYFRIKCQNR